MALCSCWELKGLTISAFRHRLGLTFIFCAIIVKSHTPQKGITHQLMSSCQCFNVKANTSGLLSIVWRFAHGHLKNSKPLAGVVIIHATNQGWSFEPVGHACRKSGVSARLTLQCGG